MSAGQGTSGQQVSRTYPQAVSPALAQQTDEVVDVCFVILAAGNENHPDNDMCSSRSSMLERFPRYDQPDRCEAPRPQALQMDLGVSCIHIWQTLQAYLHTLLLQGVTNKPPIPTASLRFAPEEILVGQMRLDPSLPSPQIIPCRPGRASVRIRAFCTR